MILFRYLHLLVATSVISLSVLTAPGQDEQGSGGGSVENEVAEMSTITEAPQAAPEQATAITETEPPPPPVLAEQSSEGRSEMDDILKAAKEGAPTVTEPSAVSPVKAPEVPPVGSAADDGTVQALVMELNRKQEALDKAKAEVTSLRGVVKEVLDANRREQFVMHYNMGCVYKNQGDYRKAEEHFLMALEKRPEEPDIHYNLGILYDDDLKDPNKARKHYQRFIELTPSDEEAAQVQEWLLSLTK